MQTPISALAVGDYGQARMEVREELSSKKTDRRYLLDRMRLGVLTLADGYPEAAAHVFEEVYAVLRAQGINRDKTVQSLVLNEDLKIWKGEPFEQALALAYYSMTMAELGSWDNARAAADNSLFYLKDFGENEVTGQRLDTQAIAQRSLLYERAIEAGATPDEAMAQVRHGHLSGRDSSDASTGDDYLDHGYVARRSNFTLGYLLGGMANQQLGREDEANDLYNQVVKITPQLGELVEVLRRDEYNTVLIVSFGLGPEKIGYGPDNALAAFSSRTPSDGTPLRVLAGDEAEGWRSYPPVLDVNRMADDHMWNNLEDVRRAKSTVGTALLYGGLFATAIGADSDSDAAVIAGLAAAATGAFLKAGSHVDIRYADVFPQRFYAVPLTLGDEPTTVTLQVEGRQASRMSLAGLTAPDHGLREAQLRYVRLVSPPSYSSGVAPQWALSGDILYGNAETGRAPGTMAPFLVGGNDARPPSERVLDQYQDAGYLRGFTLSDLRELYRSEGIAWSVEDQDGYVDRHVLEGGRSLVSPLVGTAGFARLFGQLHPDYQPRTPRVAELKEEITETLPAPQVAGR